MILFLQQQHEESEDCLPARLPVIGIIVVVVVVVVLVEVSVVLLS